jgi:tRNA U55 pseudouridine synthase TruB
LISLRRVRNGSLRVDDAVTIEQIEAANVEGTIEDLVIDPADALADLPARELDPAYLRGAVNGAVVPTTALGEGVDVGEGDVIRLMADGTLLGVYRIDGAAVKAEVVVV